MGTDRFRTRVKYIAAVKAKAILAEEAPDANQLTWAKAAISPGYDAGVEAVLMLLQSQPETVNAAMTATDAQYATILDDIFAQAVKVKV